MAKYGQTWWGQQWLNSLLHIDNDNRLPRGRSYASKGAVLSVDIKNSEIRSKVQGSRSKPYDVRIDIPAFSKTQIEKLKEAIFSRPDLLSKLLNHDLAPELDAIALSLGIKTFPSTWKDFTMKCSCPDYAVPCKHLAAVLYMVANEIDKNPFMAFQLRGLDLLSELEQQHKGAATTVSLPSLESLLTPIDKKANAIPQPVPSLDYTQITNGKRVLDLLKPNPLFHPKDFKAILANGYKEIAKEALALEMRSNEANLLNNDNFINLTFNVKTGKHHFYNEKEEYIQEYTPMQCMEVLIDLEEKNIQYLDYTWQYLHEVFLFTLRIAQQGLFLPKIYSLGEQGFIVRWIPAMLDEQVNHLLKQLVAATPAGIVQITEVSSDVHTFTEPVEQLNQLVHAFIQALISSAYNNSKLNTAWYERGEVTNVLHLFATGYGTNFTSFHQAQIPLSIYQWLSIFNAASHRYVPIVKVEEHTKGFAISLLVDDTQQPMLAPIPLVEIFENQELAPHQLQILKDISLTADLLPTISKLIANKGKLDVVVSVQEFSEILLTMLPLVKLLGARVLLPKQLKSLVHPQLKLLVKKSEGTTSVKSLVGLSQILDYSWTVAIGNEELSAEEFWKRVQGLNGLVKLRDGYMLLDEANMLALKKQLEKNSKLSQFELLQAVLAEEAHGVKAGLSEEVVQTLKTLLASPAPLLPASINATLRPYQVRGFEWLARNASLGMGSIIADDMGLGKTLQIISLLQHFKDKGHLNKTPAIIVVPTTLITNWQKEIARFAPQLEAIIYHGNVRATNFTDSEVVITSYGMVRNNLTLFEKQKWSAAIIDEAQNIKNPGTEQTKAIKKLKADIRIAMSGTPVENRLSEYWSIFDFTNKGYLGSQKSFTDNFAKPIHFNHDLEKVALFQRITAPFILRRLKSDKSIISDLPDKVEANHYAQLSPNQAALYQSTVENALEVLENTEGIERKGMVLKMLTALKQIGNHPAQFLKKGEATLDASGKLQLMMQTVQSILDSDGKTLIFTQYREMGDILQRVIEAETGERPLFLHGGCSRAQRDSMVEQFQTSPRTRIFILSLKAGGTGLNLTAAGHVIHYDLWWNPAVEAQATDRAYRIGQHQNVMVYRLINRGTIEEKIDLMINEKRNLANLTVTTGETWLGNLSNEELVKLVSLE